MAETGVMSVRKAFEMLDSILERDLRGERCGLGDIAGDVGEKLSTARNILKTMEGCGYVSRDGLRYIPGEKCRIMQRIASAADLAAAVGEDMRKAAENTGESFVLATLAGGRRKVLLRVSARRDVVANLESENEAPPYSLVTNRVMFSFAGDEERREFEGCYGSPENSWPDFENDISDIRKAGTSTLEAGDLIGYAAVLTDSRGRLLGAAGAYAPKYRVTKELTGNIFEELVRLAKIVRAHF